MNEKKPPAYPYLTVDLAQYHATAHPGLSGEALWKTLQLSGLRIREVTYSAGYLADHWCEKGHIVYVLAGTICSELATGETSVLTPGMLYVVSDTLSSHRSRTETGATLLIIDGDFLNPL